MQLKGSIPDQEKNCIVNKFKCFCDKSYIGQTSRNFKTRIKEHLPACVLKFVEKQPEIKKTATSNAAKRSSVAEYLIKNRGCARKYDIYRFKIIHRCNNVFCLV